MYELNLSVVLSISVMCKFLDNCICYGIRSAAILPLELDGKPGGDDMRNTRACHSICHERLVGWLQTLILLLAAGLAGYAIAGLN